MKRLLVLLCSTFALTAHSQSAGKPSPVGTWQMESRTLRFYEKEKRKNRLVETRVQTPDSLERCRRDDTWEYRPDGTGQLHLGELCPMDTKGNDRFRWTLSGSVLKRTYPSLWKDAGKNEGTVERYQMVEMTPTHMALLENLDDPFYRGRQYEAITITTIYIRLK